MIVAGGIAGACGGDVAALQTVALDRALEKAGKASKVVFVEFGATWCGPCKRLKETTLVDSRVQAWLVENTVPLQLDIDEVPKLAQEFRVASVPTMVFLRPDRTVLGTITGYRDVEHFLEEAAHRIKGVSAVEEAAQAVKEKPKDLSLRFQHFQELVRAGQQLEALEEAENYWQSSRTSMTQAGVRCSFFLSSMQALARDYAPARKVLHRWLSDARAALFDKDANAAQAAMEFGSLARLMQETDMLLDAAEKLKGTTALKILILAAGDLVLAARRYSILVDAGACELKVVKSRLAMQTFAMNAAKGQGGDVGMVVREGILSAVTLPFEALAGVGRESEALAVVKLAMDSGGNAAVRAALAEAAERAGNSALAKKVRDGS